MWKVFELFAAGGVALTVAVRLVTGEPEAEVVSMEQIEQRVQNLEQQIEVSK